MFSEILANLLFPPICVICHEKLRHGAICEPCLGKIPLRDSLLCGKCHASLPVGASTATCHAEFPYLLGGGADYENPAIKSLVHHLKFRNVKDAAEALGDLLSRYLARCHVPIEGRTIIPIPLSRSRERSRGYNQAELIARRLASGANGTIIDTRSLIRTRNTRPQSEIEDAAERQENLRGAFAVADPLPLRGKDILLIDDVSTTGATFLAASLALKTAGARNILALAAAKT
jgi:ComF family protein